MQCVVKIVKGGKNIISDGFSWVRVEFFFSFYGGVGGGRGPRRCFSILLM